MKHKREIIGKWILVWESDIEKGYVIDTKTDVQYSFSQNFALTHPIPQKVIKLARDMVNNRA